MPAKGRYFLNEGEEGPGHDVLYEKYRLTSQHGPLLRTLLLVAVAACTALAAIAFGSGVSEGSTGFSGVRVSARRLAGASVSSLSPSFHVGKELRWWGTGLSF